MMMEKLTFFLLVITLLSGCIKDDFIDDRVDPELRILNAVDSILVNDTHQYNSIYLNNIGVEETVEVNWSSSDDAVIDVDVDGLATAKTVGQAQIKASFITETGLLIEDTSPIVVSNTSPVNEPGFQTISGNIITTSTYVLEGDFEFIETETGVKIDIADNYKASTSLPGLYIYLSNNRNSIANALEIAAVETFNGAHVYEINTVGFNDYSFIVYFCKPFNVKVGEASL